MFFWTWNDIYQVFPNIWNDVEDVDMQQTKLQETLFFVNKLIMHLAQTFCYDCIIVVDNKT